MKFRSLALAVVMVLSLAACGTAASTPSEAPVTVTSNCLTEVSASTAPTPEAIEREILSFPLDEALMARPSPEFLEDEELALFRQALAASNFLLGQFGNVDSWPREDGCRLPERPQVVRQDENHLFVYSIATGRYALWDDFQAAMENVFTPAFLNAQGVIENPGPSEFPYFTSGEEGRLLYLCAERDVDPFYAACETTDSYELVSRSEEEIVFYLIGHYANLSYDAVTGRPAAEGEYSQSYPIRMVNTADGWRFAEFHLPY